MNNDFKLELTQYGFKWGPMEVTRVMSDAKWGLILLVETSQGEIGRLRCSPKGYALEWDKVKGRNRGKAGTGS